MGSCREREKEFFLDLRRWSRRIVCRIIRLEIRVLNFVLKIGEFIRVFAGFVFR